MRVLALLTDGFGADGGIARYNCDLMSALALCASVESLLILPRFGEAAHPLPGKIAQTAPSPGRVRWSLSAARIFLRQRFDVIFCGHLNAVPLATILAKRSGVGLWLQLHGFEAWRAPNAAVRYAAERADLVTAVSRGTRHKFLGWSNIDPARVRVLPNTVASIYSPGMRPLHLVARHDLDGNQVILTVGRMASRERYKGHDRIIEALPDVLRQCPRAVYLVVGSGDDRPRLEALAWQAGVAERVCFVGEVARAELPDYYRLADLYAMPSTQEGFGIVFVEAAASGLPVVAGNRDGSVDALADGALGRLIDPEDRTALIDAIVAGLSGRLPPNSAAGERFAFSHFAKHVDGLVRNFF